MRSEGLRPSASHTQSGASGISIALMSMVCPAGTQAAPDRKQGSATPMVANPKPASQAADCHGTAKFAPAAQPSGRTASAATVEATHAVSNGGTRAWRRAITVITDMNTAISSASPSPSSVPPPAEPATATATSRSARNAARKVRRVTRSRSQSQAISAVISGAVA